MMTTMVTLIQTAEREAAGRQPLTGHVVPRGNALLAAARRLLERIARRGFRSGAQIPSVSVPGVDFRLGRSSSV